jgi:hypothetical protein
MKTDFALGGCPYLNDGDCILIMSYKEFYTMDAFYSTPDKSLYRDIPGVIILI